ncbi:MAG: hypothetical protein EWM72_00403 [Nitrospira sp.]|nr:MAG: hypothetical protein EWM72_00403 [Nitrospira sp.]
MLPSELKGPMQEYGLYLGAACLILAVYVLVRGIAAAYRQGREDGFETLIPTPAFGVVASFLLTFGLGFLRVELPWWGFRIVFPGTTLLFPALIYVVGRRSPRDKSRTIPGEGSPSSAGGGSSHSDDL